MSMPLSASAGDEGEQYNQDDGDTSPSVNA
jgi:hypothetical protein